MSRTRRIVIASGDRLMRDSLPSLLKRQGWEVAGVAEDGVGAIAAVGRSEIDAVLIVNELSRPSPGNLARELHRKWPRLSVVVVGDASYEGSLPANEATEVVLRALESPPTDRSGHSDPSTPRWIEQLASLTPRERDTLKLLGSGLTMSQVARRLELSDHTVRTHMQKLYAKLECHSRLDVIKFATQHGIVGDRQP